MYYMYTGLAPLQAVQVILHDGSSRFVRMMFEQRRRKRRFKRNFSAKTIMAQIRGICKNLQGRPGISTVCTKRRAEFRQVDGCAINSARRHLDDTQDSVSEDGSVRPVRRVAPGVVRHCDCRVAVIRYDSSES